MGNISSTKNEIKDGSTMEISNTLPPTPGKGIPQALLELSIDVTRELQEERLKQSSELPSTPGKTIPHDLLSIALGSKLRSPQHGASNTLDDEDTLMEDLQESHHRRKRKASAQPQQSSKRRRMSTVSAKEIAVVRKKLQLLKINDHSEIVQKSERINVVEEVIMHPPKGDEVLITMNNSDGSQERFKISITKLKTSKKRKHRLVTAKGRRINVKMSATGKLKIL